MLTEEIEKLIIDVSKGNPGALQFAMSALAFDRFTAVSTLTKALNHGIIGDKLYMIWNDCCDRDTLRALQLITFGKKEEIEYYLNYEEGRGKPFKDVSELSVGVDTYDIQDDLYHKTKFKDVVQGICSGCVFI